MKKPLHKRATTTRKIRRVIQRSQEKKKDLARRWGVNVKTIAKWQKRQTVDDAPNKQKRHGRLVLTPLEEAIILFFRKGGQLPLDDCFRTLQSLMPTLTRSNLYRCLKRNKVHRLYKQLKPSTKIKSAREGSVYGTILALKAGEENLSVRLAIERRSKYVHVEFQRGAEQHQEEPWFKKPLPFHLNAFEQDDARNIRAETLLLCPQQAAWMFEDFFLAFILTYNKNTTLKALKGKTPLQKLQEA